MADNRGVGSQLLTAVKAVNPEPALVLFTVATGILQAVIGPFVYWRKCIDLFWDYVEDPNWYCENLAMLNGSRADLARGKIEVDVALFGTGIQMCMALPAALVAPLYGAWSDASGGRKRPLMIALAGFTCSMFVLLLVSLRYSWPVEYTFIGILVASLAGGPMITFTSVFSMISDDAMKRKNELVNVGAYLSLRIALASALFNIGTVAGSLLFTAFQNLPNPYKSYSFSIFVAEFVIVVAFFYTLIFVWETKPEQEADETVPVINEPEPKVPCHKKCTQFGYLMVAKYVDGGKILAKERPGMRRLFLCVSILLYLVLLCGITFTGHSTLLFVKRAPLDWSDVMYGYYTAYTEAVGAVGMLLGPALLRKLRLFGDLGSDTFFMVVGIIFSILKSTLFSVSGDSAMVFIAGTMAFLAGLINPAFRSFFSKLVDDDEKGRAFGAVAIVEFLNPLVSGPIFNAVFKATQQFWSGFIFMLSACIQLVVLAGFIVIHFLVVSEEKKEDRQMLVQEEEEASSSAHVDGVEQL